MKILLNLIFVAICIIFLNNAYCDTIDEAQTLIQQAKNAEKINTDECHSYLHKANDILLDEYKENPLNIKVLVKLSQIHQMLKNRKEAKIYILKAYNINPYNPDLQKEMGDFYYSFQEYSTAIEYYKLSLTNGNLRDFQTNLKTAKCYEKLGDKKNYELYYKISSHLNPKSLEVSEKLYEIEEINNPQKNKQNEELKRINEIKNQNEVNEIIEQLNQMYQ